VMKVISPTVPSASEGAKLEAILARAVSRT
jgi:hypothetical protein